MSEVNYAKSNKKIFGIGIITAIIIILSSLVVYDKIIKPKKYDEYMNNGNQYLSEQNYEEAIVSFDKAIKIYSDSIDARLGAAKGYIGIDDISKAVIYLKESQNLDMENEELILKIIEILVYADQKSANELLQIFIDKVGVDNLSETFKANILENSDKYELNTYIENAQNLYDNSVEGTLEGQYKSGAKEKLLTIIKEGQIIYNNYFVSQDKINSMVEILQGAINTFESDKVKAMPTNLASHYISRLETIESDIDYQIEYGDFSSADMGGVLWDAVDRYKLVMDDIYVDLNKYLSSDKKSQLSSEISKYENDKARAQAELDKAHAESPGTWYVIGEPGSMGDVVREHCYYLIEKYMK